MPARIALFIAAALVILPPVPPAARADNWFVSFWHDLGKDWERRNCWPEPFTCPDRQAAREPFAGQISRGWEVQNMIADHHFEEGSNQLTEAGRLKIRWIISESPLQHRVIYVKRSLNPQETAAHVAAVHQTMAQMLVTGEEVPVMETNANLPSWSAERIEIVSRKFNSNLPDPKLPDSGGAAGGGGGGGGSK